jgi:hypothetical protein
MNLSKICHLLTICAPLMLTACGGGGGDGGSDGTPSGNSPQAPASSAEGVYAGTLSGSAYASDFQALVLENDEIWSIYGDDLGSVFYVYGFVQGNGVSSNGMFNASSVRDFGFSPALSGRLTASYSVSNKTISGSVNYGVDGLVSFGGGPIAGSLYHYDTPASLSTIAGSWSATSSYGTSVSINVTAAGALTLQDFTCTGTGTVTPRSSGKNVFNLKVTFGSNGCALPGVTATGIAIAYPLSTGQTQIIAAVTNSARTEGVAVFGIR